MINTFKIYENLSETMDVAAAKKITEALNMVYEDLQNTVTKVEFNELREVVVGLTAAQRETKQELSELAEAQKRTEQRVEELAEAQKRTEQRVEELAGAQKRTEQRVEELAEAQKRTEQRVEELAEAQKELAEAQKRTEKSVQTLVKEHQETRRQLGGLTGTVGYTLENESYKALPHLLKKDYNLIVTDRLKRQYVVDNQGKSIEVNIIGAASRNGTNLMIIGEAKTQLSKKDVDTFLRKKVKRLEGMFSEMFLLLVTHMISQPDVEEYAGKKGIALYYSYDLDTSK